jgi:hypothetical protein
MPPSSQCFDKRQYVGIPDQTNNEFLPKDKYDKEVKSPISVGMDPVSELYPEMRDAKNEFGRMTTTQQNNG